MREEACSPGRAGGGALERGAASMVEAVKDHIRPESPSMRSGALYSGMNADSWRRRGARAGGGGIFCCARTVRSGLGSGPDSHKAPTFVSGLSKKVRLNHSANP